MVRQTKKEKIESTVARLLGTTSEPKPEKIETQGELSSLLNWYNANKDAKDAVRYLNDYAKKHKFKGKLDTNESILTTAWLCRIVSQVPAVPDNVHEHLKTKLPEFFKSEKVVVAVVEDKTPKPSIQDRMTEKVSEYAGELEGQLDDYVLSKFKNMPSPYGFMHGKVKAAYASKIIDIFKKKRAEFDEVLHTKDKELIEGYSNFTKVELKKLVAFCDQIITDALRLSDESKVSRKPRKRKAKTPEQLVAKVQICKEDSTYNLKSEEVKFIVGATTIWVFNIKNKKLGVYHALDSEGLGVKGTSLTNFSEMKSVQKVLRKPNEVLPNVVKGGKVFLRNIMDELTTTSTVLNGRLNKDTVIVKIIK